MRDIGRMICYAAAWLAVVGGVTLLALLARAHNEEKVVESVEITILDSHHNGSLVTSESVEQMLRRAKIAMKGERAEEVSLRDIESTIKRNGLIKSVKSYINYSGVLHIDVEQRRPLARIVLKGYNCYITRHGFVFHTPSHTALNTPIITGGYRPIFEPRYEGYVADRVAHEVAQLEVLIDSLEWEKRPIYERERENNSDKRDVRKRYINQAVFQSDEDFAEEVRQLRKSNQALRNKYAARGKRIEAELKVLSDKQEYYRARQKKACEMGEDIENLINFVERVEGDDFWRAEVVQIDLSRGDTGDMRVKIAVRSGKAVVTMGALGDDRQMRDKLKRLRAFYDEALVRVGWDRYREINIEYNNQVVCRK